MGVTPSIAMIETPTDYMKSAIARPLALFNEEQSGCSLDYDPLVILVSHPETGEVLGGLWGETMYSYLHVELLFIPEPLRHVGIGSGLMRQAESEAIQRGCRGAWLDTFSFQARGFYERLGYTVFGSIADCPPGHG